MPSIRTERLEIAYQQYGPGSQAPLFWYQWFMSLAGGPAAVAADPKGFARIQWDTWGPPGWLSSARGGQIIH